MCIRIPIPGYDSLYSADSNGTVLSHAKNNRPARTLISSANSFGYHFVSLCKDGICRKALLHRLIAQAFVPKLDPLATDVNHIDGDKSNNTVANLEWCTRSYNIQHAYRLGLRRPTRPKLTPEAVTRIKQSLRDGVTQERIAAQHCVSRSTIESIGLGRMWKNHS